MTDFVPVDSMQFDRPMYTNNLFDRYYNQNAIKPERIEGSRLKKDRIKKFSKIALGAHKIFKKRRKREKRLIDRPKLLCPIDCSAKRTERTKLKVKANFKADNDNGRSNNFRNIGKLESGEVAARGYTSRALLLKAVRHPPRRKGKQNCMSRCLSSRNLIEKQILTEKLVSDSVMSQAGLSKWAPFNTPEKGKFPRQPLARALCTQRNETILLDMATTKISEIESVVLVARTGQARTAIKSSTHSEIVERNNENGVKERQEVRFKTESKKRKWEYFVLTFGHCRPVKILNPSSVIAIAYFNLKNLSELQDQRGTVLRSEDVESTTSFVRQFSEENCISTFMVNSEESKSIANLYLEYWFSIFLAVACHCDTLFKKFNTTKPVVLTCVKSPNDFITRSPSFEPRQKFRINIRQTETFRSTKEKFRQTSSKKEKKKIRNVQIYAISSASLVYQAIKSVKPIDTTLGFQKLFFTMTDKTRVFDIGFFRISLQRQPISMTIREAWWRKRGGKENYSGQKNYNSLNIWSSSINGSHCISDKLHQKIKEPCQKGVL
ncbi:hypothetical protein WN51_10131 [Melipona quadrifasciata]|uniref:Uncharacterized protein n=1 Tax=Melipona quadrifasciata TaxID=166423 RepID=A0A0N0U6U3_9HYME|nr:hypothetical protein WN51_10131 [Melipona quadrifasciata]